MEGKGTYVDAVVLHITLPVFSSCVFHLQAYGRLSKRGRGKTPKLPPSTATISILVCLFSMSQSLRIFCIITGLNEVSRLTFKKKKKPNSEGNFQHQVISSLPNLQPTSVVPLGRVQLATELEAGAKNTEAQRWEARRGEGDPSPGPHFS